ncbi:SGNH/GDSL hydrolase family protein [Bacillus pinisoli]|uniref:SGNH/GDSL hydrolase family protein n=1 Tax=Bacillus pinisoli TaxID=2901866 RepID=UPI001FF5D255|nr:SGNH/GDSL hydrolase family protein [Bacillus pinisoli]
MKTLVCFGDSITAGKEGHKESLLTSLLSKQLVDFKIINSGVPGDNTNQALDRLKNDVLVYKPDLVTVLFGANDAALHKTVELEVFKENIRKITTSIGSNRTILISPAPVDEELQKARTNIILSKYADAVREVSIETESHFIDLFGYILSKDQYQTILKGLDNDGLHFGELGYEILSQLIVQKITELQN